MTLFTKDDCTLCKRITARFDLEAMGVAVEILDRNDAAALAHLAWHGLVEQARKSLPILVLDDSSSVVDYALIEAHLQSRARRHGMLPLEAPAPNACAAGACAL
ncbi:MAG: hypothetical protein AB1634_03500 [Thermodesulfobacteriota bacterium]